jgi:hypothetical protein
LPTLTGSQFQSLANIPPKLEGFANLTNTNTRRAYQHDIQNFMALAVLCNKNRCYRSPNTWALCMALAIRSPAMPTLEAAKISWARQPKR